MKMTIKKIWSGEKTVYYPTFKHALKDSLLFSVLWAGVICLLLSVIFLTIHFTNGSNLSRDIIATELLFQSVVFIISNGMFLYENWYKQERAIRKTYKLLPEGYCLQSINYSAENKKYTIRGEYKGKTYQIKVVYPVAAIKEKRRLAVTSIRIDSDKDTLEKYKTMIFRVMNFSKFHCAVCGLPLGDFAPWGKDNKTPTYDICPCCGVEWGNEDYTPESCAEYRNKWLADGAKWFDPSKKPVNWNVEEQLKNIKL